MITRRHAVKRLGLAIGAAYCAPFVADLSQARAASGSSSASPASSASQPSRPSPASAPSSPSTPSNPTRDTDRDGKSPTRSGCSQPSGSRRATINRRDMDRAQAAVASGEAKTLREIVTIVQRKYPGRLIKVGFQGSGADQAYWLQMVTGSGSVQTVTVDAGSGMITSVGGC